MKDEVVNQNWGPAHMTWPALTGQHAICSAGLLARLSSHPKYEYLEFACTKYIALTRVLLIILY